MPAVAGFRPALVCLALAAGCGSQSPPAVMETAFSQRALSIAGEYQSWGRVDDEVRWAPALCRLPLPGVARMSASDDVGTHGQKLYSVFARRRDAYPAGPHEDQVVVKEAWKAERVTDPNARFAPQSFDAGSGTDHFYPYAQKDGVLYRASERAGLYIMYRTAAGTPDTDNGWVYATLTADGKVTAAGRVASCIGCHEDAAHERLFGVPKAP